MFVYDYYRHRVVCHCAFVATNRLYNNAIQFSGHEFKNTAFLCSFDIVVKIRHLKNFY